MGSGLLTNLATSRSTFVRSFHTAQNFAAEAVVPYLASFLDTPSSNCEYRNSLGM